MTLDARIASCFALPPEMPEVTLVPRGVGSVLAGKYRLDALLGEGAMGAVFRATNLLLDAPVAIKLIRADLDGFDFRERLQFEARAAAGLGHPAIVRVFDIGETGEGDPFIVMEHLEGGTLTQMLAGGRLSAVRAVQIVLPLVDALATTHARGIVHRDLKPDNLLIASEARRLQPKIVDFGIAKLNNGGRDLADGGGLVGSPEYMSPEQANGRSDVDYRTDIWSLCVVLYEAIAGRMPFSAPTTLPLLRAIIEDEPVSFPALGIDDESLWAILRTGLAKDRHARHASMAELGKALATWLLGQGVTEDVSGTAVEPKWFGEAGAPPAQGIPSDENRIDRNASTRPAANSPRLYAKVSSRDASGAKLLPRGNARKRALGAATLAAALGGAAVLVSHLIPPKRGPVSLAVVIRPETSTRLGQSGLTQEEPALARDATRTDDPTPSPELETAVTSPAEPHPVPGVARSKVVLIAASTNEQRIAQPLARAPSARRATPARASGADLDLIAPY
ncbi:MAG TPA: serine/threonine-protein kinase [Polyangiaceae bacterium]|jgi:serine/threonine-protein kinase|nr:serine/threonine-protein kinase [Polyangiaceae bacterium]